MPSDVPARVILKSSDLDTTIEWYRRVGFTLRDRVTEPGRDWCELARDDLALQFLAGTTPWPDGPSFTGTVYVRPVDLDKAAADLQVPGGVEERPWGAREFVLRDPDGYYVTFTSR